MDADREPLVVGREPLVVGRLLAGALVALKSSSSRTLRFWSKAN